MPQPAELCIHGYASRGGTGCTATTVAYRGDANRVAPAYRNAATAVIAKLTPRYTGVDTPGPPTSELPCNA
jgi:hypothetical protein